jgi:DNA-binding response OmpR family regulator
MSRSARVAAPPIVVLAEADADRRDQYRLALIAAEYMVVTVDNGIDAIRRIADVAPDLVVLDLDLPGLHADDVFHGIVAQPSVQATPMIVLTATGIRRLDRVECGYLLDFLDRPTPPAALVSAVGKAIGQSTTRTRRRELVH